MRVLVSVASAPLRLFLHAHAEGVLDPHDQRPGEEGEDERLGGLAHADSKRRRRTLREVVGNAVLLQRAHAPRFPVALVDRIDEGELARGRSQDRTRLARQVKAAMAFKLPDARLPLRQAPEEAAIPDSRLGGDAVGRVLSVFPKTVPIGDLRLGVRDQPQVQGFVGLRLFEAPQDQRRVNRRLQVVVIAEHQHVWRFKGVEHLHETATPGPAGTTGQHAVNARQRDRRCRLRHENRLERTVRPILLLQRGEGPDDVGIGIAGRDKNSAVSAFRTHAPDYSTRPARRRVRIDPIGRIGYNLAMPHSSTTPPSLHRRIGLAVSGGADSTALLVLMADLRTAFNFDAVVLHVDHGLRPDSATDARFVKRLAADFGLPFHATRAHIVRQPRESLEMAARRVRLAFFARMAKRLRLDAIATGHHADDVAETFLLRLARGAGPDGLAGLKRISHVGPLTFIRPLLDLRDADLRAFLARRGIAWREDATNTDLSIPRNKVRHLILPWLRTHLDPRLTEHLCKTAAILRGELVRPAPEADAQEKAPPPRSFTLTVTPSTGFIRRPPSAIGTLPVACELSRTKLAGRTLALRPWRAGDRIAPTGMGGRSRKLQDVFVTAKVPPGIRATLPVLADAATGDILWVPGYRIAEAVAVESATAPSWTFRLEGRN